eukprot:1999078-Rhodomonas_salina.1
MRARPHLGLRELLSGALGLTIPHGHITPDDSVLTRLPASYGTVLRYGATGGASTPPEKSTGGVAVGALPTAYPTTPGQYHASRSAHLGP